LPTNCLPVHPQRHGFELEGTIRFLRWSGHEP
jgi:hypothetical protein